MRVEVRVHHANLPRGVAPADPQRGERRVLSPQRRVDLPGARGVAALGDEEEVGDDLARAIDRVRSGDDLFSSGRDHDLQRVGVRLECGIEVDEHPGLRRRGSAGDQQREGERETHGSPYRMRSR